MVAHASPAPASPQPLSTLLHNARGVYNIRRASRSVLRSLLSNTDCSSARANFALAGRNSLQIRRAVNKQLAQELAQGTHGAAFAHLYATCDRPRADELEKMIATFPGYDDVNWDAPAVTSGLDIGLWRAMHARHCTNHCSELAVDDNCYFKLVEHFLRTGFEPAVEPGCDVFTASPSCRAYVDQWRKEEKGCELAYDKWVTQAEHLISESVGEPPSCFFPLLPAVRQKDRWRFTKEGVPYKVRLCLDLKNGGLNDMFSDWPFQYLGLDDIASVIQPGDWLATIDISRFYLRLPAGQRLRSVQWFQDPCSYARCSHSNERKAARRLKYRQLLAVAFGLKPAPAWASVVSAELARILKSYGVRVAGTYIDDLLLCARSKELLAAAIETCEKVCSALGLHLNDKTTGPCAPHEGIKYLGYFIKTADCSITICEEHRLYAIDRLAECLKAKRVSVNDLESIAGVLSWLSFSFIPGRPRRNELYKAIARAHADSKSKWRIRGQLQRQMHWWLSTLRRPMKAASFFWCVQPDTPLICSDASGEDGWGVCTMGYHIVGPWPRGWKQSEGDTTKHMLLKELIGPAIAVILTAHLNRDKVHCAAVDNAGIAFSLNSLNCNCPQSRIVLRAMTDCLVRNRAGLVGGHAHRHLNAHTDALSHALSQSLWSQAIATAERVKDRRVELHFAILDIRRRECMLATISFERAARPFAGAARQ